MFPVDDAIYYGCNDMKAGFYRKYGKRILDILIALPSIIVLLPLIILIGILVRIFIGPSILFKQRRPGLNEKLFTLYKFRTMSEARNLRGELLPDEERLNNFGKFLRASSLDELPELFNILIGDMSLVGPRPLLQQYLPLYNEKQRRRHEVRPGLTGLAQIRGRNLISWTEKYRLDIEYIEHISFRSDLKIMFTTIRKVFLREGIHSEASSTMEPFTGEEEREGKAIKSKLLIVGAGGHGKVVADIALKMNSWDMVAFLDDNESLDHVMNIPVIGKTNDMKKYMHQYDIFIAIGDNCVREAMISALENEGARIPVLIHPSAIIGDQVDVQSGTVIMAGAVINCCSTIGKGCIINTCASIDHDNVIEDFVHISPGAHTAGKVTMGKRTWLGIGGIVKNNLIIHGDCRIGAGAVVVCDILEEGTYLGIPAKRV